MRGPFSKPKYTQVPNVYLETIARTLTLAENLCLMIIMRRTVGYHRDREAISLNEMAGATGLSKAGVAKSVNALIKRGLIVREKQNTAAEGNVASFYELRFSEEAEPTYPPSDGAHPLSTPVDKPLSTPVHNPLVHASALAQAHPLSTPVDKIQKKDSKHACMHGGVTEDPSDHNGCVLPDAACMHADDLTPSDEKRADGDAIPQAPGTWRAAGAARLRTTFGFNAGIAVDLAGRCPDEAYLNTWIRRATHLAAQEGVPLRQKAGLVMTGIRSGAEAPWVPEETAESGAKGGEVIPPRPLTPAEQRQREIDARHEADARRTLAQVADLREAPDPERVAAEQAELRAVRDQLAQKWGVRRSAP